MAEPLVCRACAYPLTEAVTRCPRCGVPHPDDRRIGTTVNGDVRLVAKIGVGGMGTVYRAVERSTGRTVAVKLLKSSAIDAPRVANYFKREARLLSQIRHANLVSLVAFGRHGDTLYIVMEYIPGQPLSALIMQRAPMEPRRAIAITLQILLALEAVHAQHIIHRDLKPENVLIENVPGQTDFVKLVDFGVAKLVSQVDVDAPTEPMLSVPGQTVGTPAYMSPEQAMALELDVRSDLYAVGAILYELITGLLTHHAKDRVQILLKRVREDPEPPSVRCPDLGLPVVLDRICSKALARERERRYPDARAFRLDLERALEALAPDDDDDTLLRPRVMDTTRFEAPRALSSLAISEAIHDADGDERGVLAIRIRSNSQHPDDTRSPRRINLLKAIWAFVRSRLAHVEAEFYGVRPDMALLVASDTMDLSALARLALALRDAVADHFPFARFGLALDQGALRLDPSHPTGLEGPVVVSASQVVSEATGNQILVPRRLLYALELRLTALPLASDHHVLLELTPDPLALTAPITVDQIAGLRAGVVAQEALRERLMEALLGLRGDVCGQALMLTGEDGAGKTALLRWLRHAATLVGVPVIQARCHNRLQARPLRPLLDMIDQCAGVTARTSAPDTRLDQLDARLNLLGLPQLETQALRALLSPRDEGVPEADLAPEQRGGLGYLAFSAALATRPPLDQRMLIVDVLGRLLRRVADLGGVVITIDDVHHADEATARALPALVAHARALPVLVVATSTRLEVPFTEGFESVAIPTFSRAAIASFVAPQEARERASGERPSPFQTSFAGDDGAANVVEVEGLDAVVERSQGAPLYPTIWREAGRPTPPPETLQHLVLSCVAALPKALQRLLFLISALGDYVAIEEMRAVLKQPDQVRPSLEKLRARGLLKPTRQDPDLWCFTNPRIRSILYKSLAVDRRRKYHRRLCRALAKHATSSERHTLSLAIHADRGEMGVEAFWAAERIGDRFATGGDLRVGEYWYFQALAALQRALAKQQAPSREAAGEFLLKIADTALRLGHSDQASRILKHLNPANDEQSLHKIALVARILIGRGDLARAQQLLARAQGRGDHDALVGVHTLTLDRMRARVLVIGARYAKAKTVLQRALDALAHHPPPPELAPLRWRLIALQADAHFNLREDDAGERLLRGGLREAIARNDAPAIISFLDALATQLLSYSRASDLIELCRTILHDDQLHLLTPHTLIVRRWQARALQSDGNDRQAQPMFERIANRAELLGWTAFAQQTRAEQDFASSD